MGTRADFYVGSGKTAQWLGSIAWDGYSIPDEILKATTAKEYRLAVKTFLESREDGTTPDKGWPWPWKDSTTTDYAYAFRYGKTKKVRASCFGYGWFDPTKKQDGDPIEGKKIKTAIFPNMKDKQVATIGPRSGLIVFQG